MKVLPVITGDHSHTLFVPELNEHYHSVFGAIAESKHIFIGAGMNYLVQGKKEIRILEIGFGTGLNALLTYYEALSHNVKIFYTSLEPFPLDRVVWEKLNYPALLELPEASEIFQKLHLAPWDIIHPISDLFILEKREVKLEEADLPGSVFDLVYFDAFGPEVQPELWTREIFEKLYKAMTGKAVLVTYSSRGSVRRAMKQSGFMVEKLPGPAGKREISRALKSA